MCPLPVDPAARKRLQDAQRLETEALRAVELAARARDRVQTKLDAANTAFGAAVAELVQTSGRARAALLLGPELTPPRRNAGSSGRPQAGDAGQQRP